MTVGSARRRITLYSRSGCHLCEVMLDGVRAACASLDVVIEVIDVDTSAELARLHGPRVPVLLVDGREVCHFRLDQRALQAALQ